MLRTAVTNYVTDAGERQKMLQLLPEIEKRTRELMRDGRREERQARRSSRLIREVTNVGRRLLAGGEDASSSTSSTRCRWRIRRPTRSSRRRRRRAPAAGGVFSIFVSDLCKGCAACVTACGEHQALRMVQETEEVNAEHETGTAFLDLLPDTSQKYLGLYNDTRPQDSQDRHAAQHADGAAATTTRWSRATARAPAAARRASCARSRRSPRRTCGRSSTRRPIGFAAKADELEKDGVQKLAALKARSQEEYDLFRQAVAHLLMGLGGEDDKDTKGAHAPSTARSPTERSSSAITAVHAAGSVQPQEPAGRSTAASPTACRVMAMAAHTGCNTVYGSTPPNNPHPYPWMNSLFQDGITVGWLLGESFIVDHGRRSVIPERLADALMNREKDVINAARVLRVRRTSAMR